MSKFIGVADVEEDDKVQITVTYDDGTVNVITGLVRRVAYSWGEGSELTVGAMCIDMLPMAPSIESYSIELLHRDEKHGYYLAAHRDVWDRRVYLWKYDGAWYIVRSALAGVFVAEDIDEPSAKRRFIGTELPELEVSEGR